MYSRIIFCWLLAVTTVIQAAPYPSVLSAPSSVQSPVLVFVCPDKGRGTDICTIRPDGTDLRRHSTGDTEGQHFTHTTPAWSPDGRHIAFLSNRAGTGTFDFYVMEADGSNPFQITRNIVDAGNPHFVSPPHWSPDGKHIAFVVSNLIGMGRSTLWIADVNGPGQRSLGITTVLNRHFQWLSASRVAFLAEGIPDVSAVDIVSLRVQPLVSYRLGFTSMSWSPDRKRLAFSAGAQSFILNHDMYVTDADASNLRRVAQGLGAQPYTWSPDGKQIAFYTTLSSGMSRPDNTVINLIKPDGTDRRVLTNNDGSNRNPAWSPDSRYIAFESHRMGAPSGIYVINAEGTDERFLVVGSQPSWSPCVSCPR